MHALAFAVSGLYSYAFWHLWAVSKRKVNQITILAILNLLMGGNIASCVIMFFIRQAEVKERALINKESSQYWFFISTSINVIWLIARLSLNNLKE